MKKIVKFLFVFYILYILSQIIYGIVMYDNYKVSDYGIQLSFVNDDSKNDFEHKLSYTLNGDTMSIFEYNNKTYFIKKLSDFESFKQGGVVPEKTEHFSDIAIKKFVRVEWYNPPFKFDINDEINRNSELNILVPDEYVLLENNDKNKYNYSISVLKEYLIRDVLGKIRYKFELEKSSNVAIIIYNSKGMKYIITVVPIDNVVLKGEEIEAIFK